MPHGNIHFRPRHFVAACILALTSVNPVLADVVIDDGRTAAQKKNFRESFRSPIAVLGDRAVKPAPVEQLRAALTRHAGDEADVAVVLIELRVVDYFPERLSAGGGLGLIHAAVFDSGVERYTDWNLVEEAGIQPGVDTIAVVLVATIDGKEVRVAASRPYEIGGAAFVRRSEGFRTALAESIDEVAAKALAAAGALGPIGTTP
jgi:hypothetical protein